LQSGEKIRITVYNEPSLSRLRKGVEAPLTKNVTSRLERRCKSSDQVLRCKGVTLVSRATDLNRAAKTTQIPQCSRLFATASCWYL
jgi:hypothetical protein